MNTLRTLAVAVAASLTLACAPKYTTDNCFGVIAGLDATTDYRVYLMHNEDDGGEQMLNIYSVTAKEGRCRYLWFEFPGQACSDSYMNEYGVCIASDRCASREKRAKGSVLYEVRTEAAQKAHSAREAVKIIGRMVEEYGYNDTGRSYLIADRFEGWVCSVVRGRHWVAQRVPDDGIMTIPNYYVIGEIDLADTVNFLGSKDIVSYARKRGWYRPRRDGEFNFRLAYSDRATLTSKSNLSRHEAAQKFIFGDAVLGDSLTFSRKPAKKIHRSDLSRLCDVVPVKNSNTVLSQVFALDPKLPPAGGCVAWCGFPNQDAAMQTPFYLGTEFSPTCHRFDSADEALEKHFTDVGNFRERWPKHFYWYYVDPSIDIDVVPHDYVVYVPKQPRNEAERDFSQIGDTFNDHFHVLDDPRDGTLYAFWTQGSFEASEDEHVAFSKSTDGGVTWTGPIMIAGSHDRVNPTPVAAWQQPMISRSGRLYCLWNQETTVKKHLCGMMYGCYSDDGGETWSKPEMVPFPIRFDADPEDPSVPPSWCNWQRPLRLGEGDRYLVACSRHGKAPYDEKPSCKVEFWQNENIDDDPEVRDIKISFFSTNRESLYAKGVESETNYVPSEGPAAEEAAIVGLPDGRLFAMMRSSTGYPIWSVSCDDGKTWSFPEILRSRDGGTPIKHPRSPCPIYDLNGPEARSGKYFALVHNTFDFESLTAYQNRGPLYLIKGKFVPDAHQPIWFGEPELFSPRESCNSFYTSSTSVGGNTVLWFGDHKYYLFGKRISD